MLDAASADFALRFLGYIFAALIVAGILALINMRRLYVLAPKLLSYSQLTDKGQIVELTLFNRSLKMEEMIEINLSPSCKYQLVASTFGETTLADNKIAIRRLAPEDELTVVFLAEEKAFSKEDIVSVTSKDTKGRVIDKLEDVLPSTKKTMIGAFVVALFMTLMFAIPTIGIRLFQEESLAPRSSGPDSKSPSTRQHVNKAIQEFKAAGWNVDVDYFRSGLADHYDAMQLPVRIGRPRRDGRIVVVDIDVINKSDRLFKVSGRLLSPVEPPEDIYIQNWFHDLLIFPKDTKTKSLRAYLPRDAKRKVLIAEFDIKVDGMVGNIDLRTTVTFDRE